MKMCEQIFKKRQRPKKITMSPIIAAIAPRLVIIIQTSFESKWTNLEIFLEKQIYL